MCEICNGQFGCPCCEEEQEEELIIEQEEDSFSDWWVDLPR